MTETKTKTVAEELREAAEKLRDTAYGAPSGPWQSLEGGDRLIALTESGRAWTYVLEEPVGHAGTAEWIALANPALAEPLASWLEKAAEDVAKAVYKDEICDIPGGSKDRCEADCRGHDPVLVCDECGNLLAPSGPKQGDRCRCWDAALATARVLNGSAHA